MGRPADGAITDAETAEERFRRLEAVWRSETEHLASSSRIVSHPAFQEIIRLGMEVVPFLLADLEKEPRLWVWALPTITGADPVAPADRGNIPRMTEAWLRWGAESGYRGVSASKPC